MIDEHGYLRDEDNIIIPHCYRVGSEQFKGKYELKYIYVEKTDVKFYLYEISIIGSPLFYIGITENTYNRKNTHLSGIFNLACLLHRKKEIKPKLNAHGLLAQELVRLYSKVGIEKCRNRIKFKVLKETDSIDIARIMEVEEIKKNVNNPNCLNKNFNPVYSPLRCKKKKVAVLVKRDGTELQADIKDYRVSA
jgi:hypothetical protein